MQWCRARIRSPWTWLAGALLVVPYYVVGAGRAADTYWTVCILLAITWGATGLRHLPRARWPWALVLLGQLLFWMGDTTWYFQDLFASERWPHLGDAFYLGGYLPIAIGLLVLLRAKHRRRNVASVVDGLILAIGVGVPLWTQIVSPKVFEGDAGLLDRIITVAYPMSDVVLVVLAVYLSVRLTRSGAMYMFGGALGVLLVGDVWYAVLLAGDAYASGHPVDTCWWVSYWLFAGLIRHPGVGELSEPHAAGTTSLSGQRIAVLTVVTLAAPVAIAVRSAAGIDQQLVALLGATVVLFLLVVVRLVIVARELERSRHQLWFDATHDGLTGLANRTHYAATVAETLRRNGPDAVAVMCIDLDDFKGINDSLGHALGDELLREVADRLRESTRRTDAVARLGGDEFAVVIDTHDDESTRALAARIVTELRRPVDLGAGVVVRPSASVGIAAGVAGSSVDSLMRDADIAMYEAKQCGKDRYEWFRTELGEVAIERFELRADLGRALERGEFRLHYQPIVRIETGEVRAIEALVRWAHPTKGMVPPVRFIPIAEETGAIIELGEWILEEACRQALAITDRPDGLRVAVNVSAVQLQAPGLVSVVRDVLRRTGLPARRLAFELTESAMIEDYAAAARTLTELRSLGIVISLDDFGTGYTSLRQIQAFPLDVVKLAATFTDMSIDADLSVLASVVTMASQLGLVAIGEGIERLDQVERLRAAGCRYAQGYLFSRPVPGDRIAQVVADIEAAGSNLGIGALTESVG